MSQILLVKTPYHKILDFEEDASDSSFIILDLYNKGFVVKYQSFDLYEEGFEKL